MPLSPGSHVGPYEILSRIGAGGMGEVFRARDTRLDRTVALKALPAQFAENAQLRLRLQREAKAISSLTHPHICALYDIGQENGTDYLVMEFLDGETLADRLSRGPLPLDEALRHAAEISGALEFAHRAGIVHRDLKPGNVILTRSGAKLLDFGLARTTEQAPIHVDAPTVRASEPLTAEGTIIGTFQYMAPEQLEGLPADARTDIFALGAVLYEMMTGKRAFEGKTRTSLIAAIVASSPPPVSALRPITPAALDHVVQRCLDKDPDARWQSAHDVRLELEWIQRQLAAPAAAKGRRLALLPWVLVGVLAIGASLAAAMLWRRTATPGTVPLTAHLLPPPGNNFTRLMDRLSISPDGRYVTFSVVEDNRLWLRDLGSLEARPLDGTEEGTFPFWSPDSRWIAFFTEDKLKKVALAGVTPVTLCAAPRGRSGTWNEAGLILFSPEAIGGIHRVSAKGGASTPLTELDRGQKETTHRWPVFLPDGKRFLYMAGAHSETAASELNTIYLTSLDAPRERTLILRARSNVIYTKGHLLYVKDNLLVAHPFDPGSGTLDGDPFRIGQQVEYDAEYFRGAFAATPDGTVVYRMKASPSAGALAWAEKGKIGEPFGPANAFKQMEVSRDQSKAAGAVFDPGTGLTDIWSLDTRDGTPARLTATAAFGEESPIWSPDGSQVLFSRHAGFSTGGDLYSIGADGTARERLLHRDAVETLPSSWSPDGRHVLFTRTDGKGGEQLSDVLVLPMEGGQPRPFLAEPYSEQDAVFSPDGRWVAYVSLESGKPAVYVTNFPDATFKLQITTQPVVQMDWVTSGLSLVSPAGVQLIPVNVSGSRPVVGTPRNVLTLRRDIINGDLVDDEKQLVVVEKTSPYETTITVTTEWLRRVPGSM